MIIYHINDITMPTLNENIIDKSTFFYGTILTNKGIRTQKEYAIQFSLDGSWTTLTQSEFRRLNNSEDHEHIDLNRPFVEYLTKRKETKKTISVKRTKQYKPNMSNLQDTIEYVTSDLYAIRDEIGKTIGKLNILHSQCKDIQKYIDEQ